MQKAKAFRILTEDNVSVCATLFTEDTQSLHLIVMAPATAAPQHYYRRFAEYVSQFKEFDVLTFDYRGIGKSLDGSLKESQATMSDWGRFDLAAVINWADKRYDKIFILGHSVAGQIFPKSPNHFRVTAAYFVGAQSAYFGHWKGLQWLGVLAFWFISLPLSIRLHGYMPGWAMGGKVAIPKRAALEWKSWGVHRQGVLQGNAKTAKQFDSVKIPIHFVSIEDDRMLAPKEAIHALMHNYKNAVTSYQYIRPRDLGLRKIGHFGFFRSTSQKKLWSMPVYFFTQYVKKFGE